MRWCVVIAILAMPSASCSVDEAAAGGADKVARAKLAAQATADDIKAARRRLGDYRNAFLELHGQKHITGELEAKLSALQPYELHWDRMVDVAPGVDTVTATNLVQWYPMVEVFFADLARHLELSKRDRKLIADAENRAKQAQHQSLPGPYRYAVVIDGPSKKGPPFATSRVVEVGQLICPNGAETPEDCDRIDAVTTRDSPQGPWRKTRNINPTQSIVGTVAPLAQTGVLDGLVRGGRGSAAEISYRARVQKLEEKVDMLSEMGSEIEVRLRAFAPH